MSDFGENLQFYRKQRNLTQEQLAEQLEVSRQTISKWESGVSYPEMEKILQLCEMFSCSMDVLIRKNAAESEMEDSEGYERHMEKRRKNITLGITLLILGVAFHQLLSGFGWQETFFCNRYRSNSGAGGRRDAGRSIPQDAPRDCRILYSGRDCTF